MATVADDKRKGQAPEETEAKPTEEQMNVRGAVAQRIDKKGTKIEDLAGNGEHDGIGG